MRRLIRWPLYAAAFIVPPTLFAAVRLRQLAAPPAMPTVHASRQDAASPAFDPARPTVVVLLGADETEITDALGPYEIFARAGRFNVYAVAPERRPVLLSGGLAVLPHLSLGELDARLGGRAPALVVVPQIPRITTTANRPLLGWMRRQAAAGSTMFSWCTGARVLAAAGLLDGRTATAHWGDLARLEREYPRVRWARGVRWIDHGSVVTSAGITSGIDASLRVLGRMAGDSAARRVARELRYPNYRFAIDPAVEQYAVRPADAVLLANAAFRVARPQVGVALYEGVGELEIGTLYDAHASSRAADVRAVAAAPGVVRSRHGLPLLPALTPATTAGDGGTAELRRLDRLVVLGRDGRSRGAGVVAAVAAAAPALRPTYLQADDAERFAYEPVLEDLARTADAPTARFAMKRLEYRSESVRLRGSAVPWGVVALPLGLGVAGLLAARALGRGAARGLAFPRER